jgi:hypothetical protein
LTSDRLSDTDPAGVGYSFALFCVFVLVQDPAGAVASSDVELKNTGLVDVRFQCGTYAWTHLDTAQITSYANGSQD